MKRMCSCAKTEPTRTLKGKPAQKVKGRSSCVICRGTGWCDQCGRCEGCGMVPVNDGGKGVVLNSIVCPNCEGRGKVIAA